jgi:predicted glutamine amidotransferase
MCELFALAGRFPTTVRFSLERFARHGGLEGPHKDGWGLAYYVDEDVRLVKEPTPAAESVCVRFLQDHPFRSRIVLSHIRRATRGAVAMKNCQPFARELGGRMHVFAHNGDFPLERLRAAFAPSHFRPVGDTDSELAFCALLDRLRPLWLHRELPALDARLRVVAAFADAVRPLGPANFIYSDGDAVFLHGDRRFHGDGTPAHPPGLHYLCRRCDARADVSDIDGLKLAADAEQEVLLAATVPLTNEAGWLPLGAGAIVVARNGKVAAMRAVAEPVLPTAA